MSKRVESDGYTQEDYERLLMEVRIKLQDSEGERQRLLRQLNLEKGKQAAQRGEGPDAQLVEELFDRWRIGLGRNKNTKLGPARMKAGLAAVKREDRADLFAAIDGIVKFPYMVRGKRARDGKPEERYDEFELALRNEINVEKFAKLGRDESPVLVPIKDDPWWRPLERAISAITREFGRDTVDFYPGPAYTREQLRDWTEKHQPLPDLPPDEWWSVCIVDPQLSQRPMRIRERGGVQGARLELGCVHDDCTEERLLAELRRLEWRRIHHSTDAPPEAVAA